MSKNASLNHPYIHNDEFKELLGRSLIELKECQCFHFPSYLDVFNMFKPKGNILYTEWMEKSRELIRAPYPKTWFDYVMDESMIPNDRGKNLVFKKRGALIKEFYNKDTKRGILFIRMFYWDNMNDTPWKWELVPIVWLILIGKSPVFMSDIHWPEELQSLTGSTTPDDMFIDEEGELRAYCHLFPRSLENEWYKNVLKKFGGQDLSLIWSALELFATRGLREKIHKPLKVAGNKRKKKNEKTARFTYKTLFVKLMDGNIIDFGRKGGGIGDPKGRHRCMAHPRRYGIDGRGLLFGKYACTVLIPSHMRGRAKHRAIKKNYLVKGGGQGEADT
jgi:hypothetical protein